jgi:hypothetical protein
MHELSVPHVTAYTASREMGRSDQVVFDAQTFPPPRCSGERTLAQAAPEIDAGNFTVDDPLHVDD